MKRNTLAVLGSIVLAGTLVAAQEPTSRQSTSATNKDATMSITGCLVQGSTPTTYVLQHAKISGNDAMASQSGKADATKAETSRNDATKADAGKSFVLTAAAGQNVDFRSQLNRQVTVTGSTDDKLAWSAATATPSSMMNEKELPKIVATSVTKVADVCTAS